MGIDKQIAFLKTELKRYEDCGFKHLESKDYKMRAAILASLQKLKITLKFPRNWPI